MGDKGVLLLILLFAKGDSLYGQYSPSLCLCVRLWVGELSQMYNHFKLVGLSEPSATAAAVLRCIKLLL